MDDDFRPLAFLALDPHTAIMLLYDLPVNEEPREDQNEISIDRLIDHIVIGPCESPDVIGRALREELKSKVTLGRLEHMFVYSDIPLRR